MPTVNLQRWADRNLLSISDAMAAATQFNWLVMGEPVNQAMFNADSDILIPWN